MILLFVSGEILNSFSDVFNLSFPSFFLGCLLCRKQSAEPCPLHGLTYASRQDNGFHTSKAMRSLPQEVCLCRSSVPGAEFGVCTRRHIPAGTWIGPFEGKRVRPGDVKAGMDTSFMWEVGSHYSGRSFKFQERTISPLDSQKC